MAVKRQGISGPDRKSIAHNIGQRRGTLHQGLVRSRHRPPRLVQSPVWVASSECVFCPDDTRASEQTREGAAPPSLESRCWLVVPRWLWVALDGA
jgi:hypothetical protein